MQQLEWVILIYKIASEPTKYRATIWREIKSLGGLYLQNGVCIFPDIDDVSLNVSSLASQIRDMGGTEYMFFTSSTPLQKSEDLIRQFQESRSEEYELLLTDTNSLIQECTATKDTPSTTKAWGRGSTELQGLHSEYRRLRKQFQLIKARDYFAAPVGHIVLERVQQAQSRCRYSCR